ncbi:2-nitropropane dioxygenase [Luteitalea sp. TBR-22]|uniref:nitronate monooxygenase n=1 Tax=Luteitalea sp. TBR-22 TaxID=2802971 RepID=UPI001AF68261|nr:nitronate monooxygenase [Luteitalea sp. TBR-22]BCS34751.1 2-nitropropane dioxygenase [Luteitalea sp. TBR-22]
MGDVSPEAKVAAREGLPVVIQGGMGVAISDWHLARAVSTAGALGVVSGTALDQVLVRRLQDGDQGGHVRMAFDAFPVPELAERVWARFHIPGGKGERQPYATLPMQARENSRELEELCVLANFVEVWLARQGHDNPVGINYLEKIQIPHLPSIYGALLAGVEYILMGAGIPLKIPGAIDALARHEPATYPLAVTGAAPGDDTLVRFDPASIVGEARPPLHRPRFLAIVGSSTLALTLLRKANGRVDGFIIEGPTAGGHNAPPRGKLQLNDEGEPIYGERDRVDLAAFREFGVPFWLAGGYGSPEGLRAALAEGAAGVQVGTAFALCEDSGMRPDYRAALLAHVREAGTRVKTDPFASPTGFPFKVAQLPDTVSVDEVYAARPRICDLGYLREAYRADDGTVGYRCAAEPVSLYVAKGGDASDTVGRKCICNALMATAGFPQVRAGKHVEAGIVTSGDALTEVARFLQPGADGYGAADVVRALLGTPG